MCKDKKNKRNKLGLSGKMGRQAQRIIQTAEKKAQKLKHSTLNTLHLLWAIIKNDGDITDCLDIGTGTKIEATINTIEARLRHDNFDETGKHSSALDKVLDIAKQKAESTHMCITTHHLLLGILCCDECPAYGVMQGSGIDLDSLKENLERSAKSFFDQMGDASKDLIFAASQEP